MSMKLKNRIITLINQKNEPSCVEMQIVSYKF